MGFGWESEAIALKLSTMFDFQDCYKTMINDLSNWGSTFEGKDAKWIDSCTPSTGSGLITLKDWQITEALNNQALIGGTASGGRGCWQFAQWTTWTPYVAQMGLNVLKEHLGSSADDVKVSFSEWGQSKN